MAAEWTAPQIRDLLRKYSGQLARIANKEI